MDPATRRALAVIDWADAALGNPVVDFLFLNHWLGEGFIERLLSHYNLPVDDGFHDRLRFNTTATAIIWTAEAHRLGDPVDAGRWADWFTETFESSRPTWPSV